MFQWEGSRLLRIEIHIYSLYQVLQSDPFYPIVEGHDSPFKKSLDLITQRGYKDPIRHRFFG